MDTHSTSSPASMSRRDRFASSSLPLVIISAVAPISFTRATTSIVLGWRGSLPLMM